MSIANPPVEIRSPHLDAAEVSYFAPLCGEDAEFLGVLEPRFASTWEHCSDILLAADRLGFRNILCPSSYIAGPETLIFASAVAPLTRRINLLTAVRCGEWHPPMLARGLATLDHVLKGRLTVNIISSDLPGTVADSPTRYQRSREVIEILKQAWTRDRIEYKGQFYQFDLPSGPGKPYQVNGGPLLYFGGLSPDAKALAAEHVDVALLWPETEERLVAEMCDFSTRAAAHGRRIDFGLRIHVIVRETEAEARAWARRMISRLDDKVGEQIKNRSLDTKSVGVRHQAEMRDLADDEGYAEPNLWTGIGRARSGCGCALVGDPDQVVAKIQRYQAMGFRSFILSGYPHRQEVDLFGRYVLPRLKTCSLPHEQGRAPTTVPGR